MRQLVGVRVPPSANQLHKSNRVNSLLWGAEGEFGTHTHMDTTISGIQDTAIEDVRREDELRAEIDTYK